MGVRSALVALVGLVALGSPPARAVDFEARRAEHVPPLYESTCAEVHERGTGRDGRVYSVFLESRGSIRMTFRPGPQCRDIETANPDADVLASTHVVPANCELVRIESRRESRDCPDVWSGSYTRKDRRLRWEGARFILDPVRAAGFSVKPLPDNRHVRITLSDPDTEVLLSFDNPDCDPAAGFRADVARQEPQVIVFQPPPQAGFCGQGSVLSRRLLVD